MEAAASLGRWSYEVKVDGWCFRGNRCQQRSTLKSSPEPNSHIEESHWAENERKPPVVPESLPN